MVRKIVVDFTNRIWYFMVFRNLRRHGEQAKHGFCQHLFGVGFVVLDLVHEYEAKVLVPQRKLGQLVVEGGIELGA